MLFEGMTEPALRIIRNVRRRYDGARRNPWAETEAGWHYVRSMASWSCFIAASGFSYDAAARAVHLRHAPFHSAWFTANGWGTFSINDSRFTLHVEHGEISCRSILGPKRATPIFFESDRVIRAGKDLILDL
jgi:hypothetical protein